MPIRDLAKRLPHPLLMRLFHAHYERSARKLTKDFSLATGIPLLSTCDLSKFRQSDTVFILGSGPSINEISDAHWKGIARHDTIGFNFWPVHKFVPRIFVFESVRAGATVYGPLFEQLAKRAEEYRGVLKFVSEVQPIGFEEQLGGTMRECFRENYYVIHTVPVVSRNADEFAAGLRFMRDKGAFAESNQVEWIFKYGGSVVAMITLAMKMGYKKIVLCGIDLGKQEYFYQDSALYPEVAHWEFAPKSDIHLTTRTLPYLVPAQQVVWQMKRVILDAANIPLSVENSSSTLYPEIPQAPESIFE
jgi:hypothetical protein